MLIRSTTYQNGSPPFNIINTGLYGKNAYLLVNAVTQENNLGNLVISRDSKSCCRISGTAESRSIFYGLDNEVCIDTGPYDCKKERILSEIKESILNVLFGLDKKFTNKNSLYFVPCVVHTAAKSNEAILKEIDEDGWPFDGLAWFYLTKKPWAITTDDMKNVIQQMYNNDTSLREDDPFIIESRRIMMKSFFETLDKLDINYSFLIRWMKGNNPSIDSMKKFLKEESKRPSADTMYFSELKKTTLEKIGQPEFKKLLDMMDAIEKLDWIDPIILTEKKVSMESLF